MFIDWFDFGMAFVLIWIWNWGKMVVAITGATGFIGSKLVDRLVAGVKPYYLAFVLQRVLN